MTDEELMRCGPVYAAKRFWEAGRDIRENPYEKGSEDFRLFHIAMLEFEFVDIFDIRRVKA